MRKFIKMIVVCAVFFCTSSWVHAAGVQRVVYVNGIQNTEDETQQSMRKMECLLKDNANPDCPASIGSVNHEAVKRDFVADYVWNPIGWWGTEDGFDQWQDFQELFALKVGEERHIFLLQALKQAVSARSSSAVANAAIPLQNYAGDLLYAESASNNELVRDGDVDSVKIALTQATITGLLGKMSATDQTIIVAHSEGNLLAHIAYAKFAALLPDSAIKKVRILNVGNTAQFSMHDLNLTNADDDALYGSISGLIHLADRFDWTRTTPSCGDSDCAFSVDNPTMMSPSGSGFYDHNFKDVYLSDSIVEVQDARGVNYTPDKKRFRDRFEDLVYHGIASLDDANTPTYTEVYHTDFWVNGQGITGYDTTEGGPHWTFNSAMFNPNQYNEGWWEFKPTSAGATGRMTISLPNIQVARGSGYGNIRISWRQYVAGSKEYRMVAGARNSSGANFALVATSPGSNYACKGAYGIVTDSTSACYGHWSSLMNRWVDVVAVVGVNKLELTVNGVTYTDTSPRLPIIDSFEFHVAGNAIMYVDYLKIEVQNP